MSSTEIVNQDSNIEVFQETSIKDHLLQDEVLAQNLNTIAENATKTVTSKDEGSWEVPDYGIRLKALDMQFRLKGHYEKNNTVDELPDGIYLFKKSPQKKIEE